MLLEVVDEVAHRLFRQLRALGEIRQTGPLRRDVLKDGGVGGADVVEPGLREAGGDPGNDLLERNPEQDSHVGSIAAGLAAQNRPSGVGPSA